MPNTWIPHQLSCNQDCLSFPHHTQDLSFLFLIYFFKPLQPLTDSEPPGESQGPPPDPSSRPPTSTSKNLRLPAGMYPGDDPERPQPLTGLTPAGPQLFRLLNSQRRNRTGLRRQGFCLFPAFVPVRPPQSTSRRPAPATPPIAERRPPEIGGAWDQGRVPEPWAKWVGEASLRSQWGKGQWCCGIWPLLPYCGRRTMPPAG